MNNWIKIKLGDHISTQKGFAFKSKWYRSTGRSIVKVSNFTENSVDSKGLERIPVEIAEKYNNYSLNQGDVVIQTVGSWPSNPKSVVGKVISIPSRVSNSLLNQNAVKIIPKASIDNSFLFYFLKSSNFSLYIVGCAQGAASQASITLDSIKNYESYIPNKDVQAKIANILSKYDELIENNNQRIQILEEMAQRLYEEWFVHFKFPGHKKINMVDSEQGYIPEGWKVLPFPELVAIQRGKSYRSIDLSDDEGLEFITLKCIERNGGFRRDGLKKYTGDYKDGHIVYDGDIVMAVTDMTQARDLVGRVALIPKLKTDGVISMDLVKIIPKNIDSIYLYSYLRYSSIPHRLKNMANGANVLHLRPDKIESQNILLPPNEIIDTYSSIASKLIELKNNLEGKNEILSQTRDLLLPKLITGEVEV